MSKKTKRERQERQFKLKIVIIAAISIVVLGLAVTVGVSLYRQYAGAKPESGEIDKKATEAAIVYADKSGKLRDQAQVEISKNDTAKADEIYQAAVSAEPEATTKVKLYIDLANAYYGAGKLDDAIAAAIRAENANSDKFLAADWLARAYKVKGDYTKSLKYYEIASNSVGSPQNELKFDKSYYDEDIAAVKKLQSEAAQ